MPSWQPEPAQAHVPRPPIAQQTPRGREPRRPAPPAVDPNIVDLPPAPVVERPRPAWPSPTDLRVEPPIIPAAPVLEAARAAAAAVPAASQAAGGPTDLPAKFGPDWIPPASGGAEIEPDPLSQLRQEAPRTEVRWMAPSPDPLPYRGPEPVPPAQAAPPPEAPALAEDSDELPYSAASRLGGLRTLLVSLGLKALNKEAEFHGEETDLGHPPERNAERPVYAEPVSVSPSRGAEALAPDAASVKATPEFLPPKPALEATTEREKDAVRPVPKRLRWDDPQDVETLPSWRGQYRKRR